MGIVDVNKTWRYFWDTMCILNFYMLWKYYTIQNNIKTIVRGKCFKIYLILHGVPKTSLCFSIDHYFYNFRCVSESLNVCEENGDTIDVLRLRQHNFYPILDFCSVLEPQDNIDENTLIKSQIRSKLWKMWLLLYSFTI